MGEWQEGKWSWKLEWNRELMEREQAQIQELTSLINEVHLIEGKKDGWNWKPTANGRFSVKSAYKTLCMATNRNFQNNDKPEFDLIWKAPAIHKAKITAWKVLNGRIATCDNLIRRQIPIPREETLCGLCKTSPESIAHIFFSCFKAADIWYDLVRWLGKHTTLHFEAKDHLFAFVNLGNKKDKQFLTGVWICTVWCLWKGRNEGKFKQGIWQKDKLIAEIKSRIWGWMVAYKIPANAPDFRTWFSNAHLHG
ncbi:uncharacterized protein LOC130993929 [Salvia miltiorrhiza]|uniref:uncharacterized protein LOC130993929 n=1 Tax=Salvia miltiorrhiza TaxID=226208 RepID=UPI0025AC3536|nr:uncharacterized protein LOC130993929 [Salvia miltiorrhiza]